LAQNCATLLARPRSGGERKRQLGQQQRPGFQMKMYSVSGLMMMAMVMNNS
jgi:hypothetical protein